MKKFKILVCLMAIFVTTSALGGCFINDIFSTVSVSTPRLEIDEKEKTLTWAWDHDVVNYQLFDDETKIDTFTLDDITQIRYTIDFNKYLNEFKEYKFKVVAYVSDTVFKNSNTIIYFNQQTDLPETKPLGQVVNGSNLAPVGLKYDQNTYTLSWQYNAFNKPDSYFVSVINSNDDIYTFETTESSVNVYNHLNKDINVFRVASHYESDPNNYYYGDMIEFNLSKVEDVYKQIYYFNGDFNDYYINSSEEFINVLYYSFIAKDENVFIKFSPAGLIDVMGNESYLTESILAEYLNSITETCYYDPGYKAYSLYEYKITFNFQGVTEPTTSGGNIYKQRVDGQIYTTTLKQSSMIKPFYVDYEDTTPFDLEFKSDSKLILQPCDTSEELYWAIESGATPVPTENSTAFTTYNYAKTELQKIVTKKLLDADDEYELALALFDYVAYSSIYDYGTFNSLTNSTNATKYDCFYLESLLSDNKTRTAVCDGFSKTYSLLCNMIGIECQRVTGMAKIGYDMKGNPVLGAHAWNRVKVQGCLYVVDITWTEYKYQDTDITFKQIDEYEILGHEYFMVNDEYVKEDHFGFNEVIGRENFKKYYGSIKFDNYFPKHCLELSNAKSENHCSYYYYTHQINFDGYLYYYTSLIKDNDSFSDFVNYLKNSKVQSKEVMISGNENVVREYLIRLNSVLNEHGKKYNITPAKEIDIYDVSADNQKSNRIKGFVYLISTVDPTVPNEYFDLVA